MIKMAEQIKVKKQSSIKRNRFLKHFFTYLYMTLLSIIIIYPLLITTMTAFKNSDVVAFTLDFSGPWTLNNFKELFTNTLYGTWYGNTLIISIFTMVIQVAPVAASRPEKDDGDRPWVPQRLQDCLPGRAGKPAASRDNISSSASEREDQVHHGSGLDD